MKVLVATQKPFAKVAVDGIRQVVEAAGMELVLLEKYATEAELCAAVASATALIVRSDKVTPAVLDAAPQLKIVVRAGAGFDNLDLPACTAHGVVAMNTPGQNSNAVAELALGLMVYMARNQFQPGTGCELKGKRIGIHAFGNVGRLVGELAKGFGMEVWAYDPFLKAQDIEKHGVKAVDSVEALYAGCEYVSLHIPATPQTKQSINAALMGSMPKGACLINTARKEVIHEEDLAAVLEARPDFKYAADVAPANLEDLRARFGARVFATPKKMGAETAEANVNAALAAARQIVGYLQEGITRFQLNK